MAYDLLGLVHYHLDELDIAEIYHNKMLNGETEPNDSLLRTVGIKLIQPS